MSSQADHARALLARANDDFYLVRRLRGRAGCAWLGSGFPAQQVVEKALKSALTSHGIEYPRTHNLVMLVELDASARAQGGDQVVRPAPVRRVIGPRCRASRKHRRRSGRVAMKLDHDRLGPHVIHQTPGIATGRHPDVPRGDRCVYASALAGESSARRRTT